MARTMQHLLLAFFTALPSVTFAALHAIANNGLTPPSTPYASTIPPSNETLPTVKLPYATYRASSYDPVTDIYTFKNIRFAAPPTGELRWSKPAPPPRSTSIETGAYGPSCPQGVIPGLPPASGGSGGAALGEGSFSRSVLEGLGLDGYGAAEDVVGEVGNTGAKKKARLRKRQFPVPGPQSEDCLFLDVFVPGAALRSTQHHGPPGPKEGKSKPLPVVNWIYGGAYITGSKEIYSGTPLLKTSNNSIIYVAANYRLGALGWLASSKLVEEGGVPNAALWDQRAVFEWIRDKISKFGGDPEEVSVWGESAGAGSIMHHLVAFGGDREGTEGDGRKKDGGEKQDAFFKRAVMQSPAYDPQIDTTGALVKQFDTFASMAGCTGGGGNQLACLRAASSETLTNASNAYVSSLPGGKPGWGPAVDGDLVEGEPSIELLKGKSIKSVQAIINSHVADEAELFTPPVVTNQVIQDVLNLFFGSSPAIVARILQRYSGIADPRARYKTIIQYMTFTCHNRYITQGYPGRTYNLIYSRTPGTHGSDLSPTFYDPTVPLPPGVPADPGLGAFAPQYQKYLLSLTKTGNPDTLKDPESIQWPIVKFGSTLSNVLDAGNNGFTLVEDPVTGASECDFWAKVYEDFTGDVDA